MYCSICCSVCCYVGSETCLLEVQEVMGYVLELRALRAVSARSCTPFVLEAEKDVWHVL